MRISQSHGKFSVHVAGIQEASQASLSFIFLFAVLLPVSPLWSE